MGQAVTRKGHIPITVDRQPSAAKEISCVDNLRNLVQYLHFPVLSRWRMTERGGEY